MNIKFIDLFAGIGGFRYGLEKTKGFECVYSNEWDKYAAKIYDKNFNRPIQQNDTQRPESDNNTEDKSLQREYLDSRGVDTRDIRTVKSSEIPDFDLLVGGFPCQAFSIAGKRKGFDDTRGTLFFEIARILADKRPRYFILENVKGLLSHDEGKTFQTILGVLSDLGYEYQWQVLNSKNFGVPQNRERVFIIGNLRGEPRPKVFPLGNNSGKDNAQVQLYDRRKLLEGNEPKSFQEKESEANRYPLKFLQRNQKNIEGDYSFTVDGANTGGVKQDMKIRRLTPTECERLQGFPDGWTEGISDTQRYKCLGNAVTTNVVEWIGKQL